MKTNNIIISAILGLMLVPSFLFGQGVIISSNAYVVANSGYVVVTGNMANSGALNLKAGSFTMSGNYTNSGTYAQGTGSIVFNGQNQALNDNGSGTMFTNVFFSGNGGSGNPAVMSSGNFLVSSTGILNMVNATYLNANGHLTMNSDAGSSATVAAIPSAAGITGNVSVQRYLTGGSATYRGYRLLSSPVYGGSMSLTKVYSINYLKNSIYLTGTSTTGGFDNVAAANPTLYLFRENMAPLYTTFLNSNYKGINNITAAPTYSMDDAANPAVYIPVGNGFLCFFRGNRASATYAAETSTTYIPQTVTSTTSGTLNQGQITVKNWFTPSLSTLSFTAGSPVTVRGYNLVGNPYASSIDWETFQTSTTTTGIYGTGIGSTMYVLDPASKNYGAYLKGTGGAGTNNATNIIASGQGFYVLATATTAQLIFNESAKTNTQVVTPKLLMGMPADYSNSQYMRLQLAKDSTNTDDLLIRFNSDAKTVYDPSIDAPYMQGFGQVSISSFSSDRISLAINMMPLPLASKRIDLNVNTKTDGVYSINMKNLVGIPQLYDIWLMDAFSKDSLDMRQNKTYGFNVVKSDSASFGPNRFSLVIRQNLAYAYHLLDFAATKVPNATQVQLVWKTENEQNYTHFTIERSIDNGKTFDILGGFGSTVMGTYSFPDKNPAMGVNQYRLKQEDLNGTISYSKVIPVMYSNLSNNIVNNAISVYPNPAVNTLNLTIDQNQATAKHSNNSSYAITIINSSGSIIKTATSTGALWQGNVSRLMPGTYLIQVVDNANKNVVGESKFLKL